MKPRSSRHLIRVLAAVLVAVLLAGCGATPAPTPLPPTATAVPPTATPIPPTATPIPPTATPVPPTATKPPSPTPVPPPTPMPTPTQGNCTPNAKLWPTAGMFQGRTVRPGQQFRGGWDVGNTGTCTWTTDYSIVQVGGAPMGAATSFTLQYSVAAAAGSDMGTHAPLEITLTAPITLGEHASSWRLRDSKGVLFGDLLPISIIVRPAAPKASITAPADGFKLAQGVTVDVTFQASGDGGIATMSLISNGDLLYKYTPPAPAAVISTTFAWKPAPGSYNIYVTADDTQGQQGSSAHIYGTVGQ